MNVGNVRYATVLPFEGEYADLDNITNWSWDVRQDTAIRLWTTTGRKALDDEAFIGTLEREVDDGLFYKTRETARYDLLRAKRSRTTKDKMADEARQTEMMNLARRLGLRVFASSDLFIAEPDSMCFEDIDRIIEDDDYAMDLSPEMERIIDLYDQGDEKQREIIRWLITAGVEQEQTGTVSDRTRQRVSRLRKVAREQYGWELDLNAFRESMRKAPSRKKRKTT